MKVVMFAWGNPSRGDDGVGPWFAQRYRDNSCRDFTLVEDSQLQIEHILDCQQAELLLFTDARSEGESYTFEKIRADDTLSHTSHSLSPAELLGHYRRVLSHPPPPAFQLTVAGTDFELGHAMSERTLRWCERAAILLDSLLENPMAAVWETKTC